MIKKIKSATIILEKSDGRVLMCKRSPNLSFFPGMYVFPGGKIEVKLPDDWTGEENEVKIGVLRELFEEVGILAGSKKVFTSEERKTIDTQDYISTALRDEFKSSMVFVGRRRTPEFQAVVFDTAYYLVSGKIVDELEAIPDGSEITEVMWINPKDMLQKWANVEVITAPPTTHTLRNLRDNRDKFEMISLVETDLPIGLQTKVELSEGFEAIPFRSSTIPPFFTTTMVVIKSQDDCLIVDPGASEPNYEHLQQYLRSLDNTPRIFLTHHHKDHWDAMALVEKLYPNTEVIAHPNTLAKLSTKLKTKPIEDGDIRVGELNLQVKYTPGHTNGHLCLFEPTKRILVAGDHVVGRGSAVLGLEDGDMKAYFESTEQLRDLNPRLTIPAHGPPNFNGQKLLQQYIDHRLARENAILDAINNGSKSLEQILEKVYTDVPKEMWNYAKANIILHVRKLNIEGKTELQFNMS